MTDFFVERDVSLNSNSKFTALTTHYIPQKVNKTSTSQATTTTTLTTKLWPLYTTNGIKSAAPVRY